MMKLINLIFYSLLLFLVTFSLQNCAPTTFHHDKYLDYSYFKFCDFPKNLGTKVKILATYSGVEEYWSLHSIEKCKSDSGVDLNLNNIYDSLPERIKKSLLAVHNSYWNKYVIIEATGKFEMNKKGYGHLGHNKAEFIVDEILNVELIKKNNR